MRSRSTAVDGLPQPPRVVELLGGRPRLSAHSATGSQAEVGSRRAALSGPLTDAEWPQPVTFHRPS